MALSTDARNRLQIATTSAAVGSEIANAIDSNTLLAGGITTGPLNLFVDPSVGSDANSGLFGSPTATIKAAISKIPLAIQHPVVVMIAPGTYSEHLRASFIFRGLSTSTDPIPVVRFKAQSYTLVTPATGPGTGTFTSVTGTSVNLTGAAWTVNDLRGKFVQVTSGALNGQFFPIASNTATALELVVANAALSGATFNIVTQSVLIVGPASATGAVEVTGVGDSTTDAQGGVIFDGISIASAASTAVIMAAGCAKFFRCVFPTSQALGGIFCVSDQAYLNIQNTYFVGMAVNAQQLGGGFFTSVIARGGVNGMAITAAKTLSFGGVILEGASSDGLSLNWAPTTFTGSGAGLICRSNGGCGMKLSGPIHADSFVMSAIGNTSHGIWLSPNTAPIYGGHGHIAPTTGSSITTNGGDGIRIDTSHNSVYLRGTADVSSNTGWGVRMGAGVRSTFNTVAAETGATLATNTAGQMTVDGSTDSSLANVRAASPKIIANATVWFNRLCAD